ncbi:MAG: TPR end-of-group domain-containing protein, partial [Phycisphaerales bacterium JB040]
MLAWLIENTVIAGVLAGVLLLGSKWLERRPAVGNFGWLLVIALLVMPPLPRLWQVGVRDVVTAPVGWVAGWFEGEPASRERRTPRPGFGPTDGPGPVTDEMAADSGQPSWGEAYKVTESMSDPEARGEAARSVSEAWRPLTEASEGVGTPSEAGETESPERAAPPVVWPGATPAPQESVHLADAGEGGQIEDSGRAGLEVDMPYFEIGDDGSEGPAVAIAPERSASTPPGVDDPERAGVPALPGEVRGVSGGGWGVSWSLAAQVLGVLLLVAWAVGAVIAGRRQARRVRSMRRLQVSSERNAALERRVARVAERLGVRTPRAIVSDRVSGPMVWSLGRPVLVWPSGVGLEGSGVDGMIAHELAHLRRGDHWSAWLELAALTLFWWHPLVWISHRRAREYAELACDAWVSWALPSDRRAYAEALVSAAMRRSGIGDPGGGPALAFGVAEHSRDDFTRRLTMVMTGRGSRRLPPAIAAAGLGLVMMLAPSVAGELTVRGPETVQVDRLDRELRPVVRRALLAAEAERMADSGRPDEAIELYREAIGLGAKNLHEDLALACYYAEDWRGGAEAFVRAFEADGDADMMYNAACCAALGGKNRLALEYLERAVRAGYADADHMASDTDLESIHGTDEFATIAELASAIEELDAIADEAVDDENWSEGLRAYAKLAELVPSEGTYVHMASYCAIMARDLDSARVWLDKQLDTEHAVATAMYNYACLESLSGNGREAMAWLERSIEAGFGQHSLLKSDPDLDGIRDREGFEELVARAQMPQRLQREMELAVEFDDWDAVLEKSEALIELVGADDWRSSHARHMMARAHEHSGNHAEAIELAIRSAASGHDVHSAMVLIARNHALAGDADEGAEYLAAAIEMGAHVEHDHDEAMATLEQHASVKAAKDRQRFREELAMFDATDWNHLEQMANEKIESGDHSGWDGYLMLGWANLRQGEYAEAARAFKTLYENGTRTLGAYNTACAYSLMGDADGAFEWLDRAVEAGFDSPGQYADDPDLDPLHEDSRWESLMKRLRQGDGHEKADTPDEHEHDHDADESDEDESDEDESDDDSDWDDPDLDPLHEDSRWESLMKRLRQG